MLLERATLYKMRLSVSFFTSHPFSCYFFSVTRSHFPLPRSFQLSLRASCVGLLVKGLWGFGGLQTFGQQQCCAADVMGESYGLI